MPPPYRLAYARAMGEYDVVDRETGIRLGTVHKVVSFQITGWVAWANGHKIPSSLHAGRFSSRAAAAQAVYDAGNRRSAGLKL